MANEYSDEGEGEDWLDTLKGEENYEEEQMVLNPVSVRQRIDVCDQIHYPNFILMKVLGCFTNSG
jgi:hypothetical protein